MQTLAQYLMGTLRCSGVHVMFGYPGQANVPLLRAAQGAAIRYVQTADERSAGFAATGYIQSTAEPAVICVSKGPGTTNLLTPLVSAHRDGVPLLAIAANVGARLHGRNAFQEFNTIEAYKAAHAVKLARRVESADALPKAIADLFAAAWTEPCGPVLLDMPDDILDSALNHPHTCLVKPTPLTTPQSSNGIENIRMAVECLEASVRPVLVVGRGSRRDYEQVREFVKAYDIPAVHTMGGIGVLSSDDPLSGGLLRHNGKRSAASLVQNADLIIALGTGLDERATADRSTFAPGAVIVHVDVDVGTIGRSLRVDIPIVESIATFLTTASSLLHPRRRPDMHAHLQQFRPGDPGTRSGDQALSAREVVERISTVTPEPIIVLDSGSHKYWVANHGRCSSPSHVVASCHFGAMGFGLPAAIGASIGHPLDTVLAVCGDGCLLMALADLHTLTREKCPNLKIIVFNNGGLGSTRDYELRRSADFGVSDFGGHVNFSAYGTASGLKSVIIADRDSLAELPALLAVDGPALFDCRLDRKESMSPSVPYTGQLSELVELSQAGAVGAS